MLYLHFNPKRSSKSMHMDQKRIPRHIAIIMDGNGRWAKERGLERVQGHIQGVESVRKVVRAAASYGVEYLTIYAFSTENWGRPSREVEALMKLLCECTLDETPTLLAEGVRMRFLGDIDALSVEVRQAIRESEQATADNKGLTLQIAVNYSSRWELTRMARLVASKWQQDSYWSKRLHPRWFPTIW
jgi:undecaprenyl diphosphate synthase